MSNTASIPTPGALPVVGHLPRIDASAPVSSLMRLFDDRWPIFRVTLPSREFVVLTRHHLVAEACDPARFVKTLSGPLQQIRAFAGSGLFTAWSDEPEWGRAHRILMPAFGPDAVLGYHDRMVDIAQQLVDRWTRFGPDEVHDVPDQMTRLTLDTIALCGFDYRFNSFYRETMHPFVDAMVGALQEAGQRAILPTLLLPLRAQANHRFEENRQLLFDVVTGVINARKDSGLQSDDLLGRMMQGRDPVDGSRLSDNEMRDQIVTFLIAGHETTSGLLSFALRALLRHPQVLAQAREEVDRVLGDAAVPTADQVQQLHYLERVLKETLRLWPTAPAFAVTPRATTLLGDLHEVHPGDSIAVLTPALHRDPAVWTDPERFDPDRFSPERIATVPPTAWRPFGTGARACIGRPFAMHEALLVLAMLLRRFELEDVAPDAPLRLSETLTVKPADFRVRARPREDAPTRERAHQAASAPHTPPPAASHGTPVMVLYGSNSGTCEGMAERLGAQARQRGWEAEVLPLDARVDQLPTDRPVLIVTASYNGEPPDNAAGFVRWLDGVQPGSLAGVRYAVLGAGHPDWSSTFMAIPKRIDAALAQAGAERLLERGAADVSSSPKAVEEAWSAAAWPVLAEAFGVEEVDAGWQTLAAETVPAMAGRAESVQALEVLEVADLTAPDAPRGRRKVRLSLRLPEGETYQVGDHLLVLPENPPALVARALRRLGADSETWIRLVGDPDSHPHLPVGGPVRLADVLSRHVALSEPPTPETLRRLADLAPCPPDARGLRALAEEERWAREVVAPGRTLLHVLDAVPSARIDAATLLTLLPPMRPRRYSIASSPRAQADRVELCVAVLDAPHWSGEGRYVGTASGYLAGLKPGQSVRARVVPCGKPFAPPEGASPLVLIAAGSGLAPFIGFLEELEGRVQEGQAVGPVGLFFGCDHPDRDRLYGERLDAWERAGLVRVYPAYDQLPDDGIRWVQHRVAAEAEALREALRDGGSIFVCGDGKRMAPGVREVLTQALGEETLSELQAEGRYLEDVFA